MALDRSHKSAAVASSEVLLNELPGVRLIAPEPVIHIVGDPKIPGDNEEAHLYTLAQYQCWDILCGRMEPELGGRPEYLDLTSSASTSTRVINGSITRDR